MASARMRGAHECRGFVRIAGIFHGKKERAFFTPVIEDTKNLLVPMICICEVFKKIHQEQGQGGAEIRIANLYKSQVLDLTDWNPPQATPFQRWWIRRVS